MGHDKRSKKVGFFFLKKRFYLGLFILLPAFFCLFAVGGFALVLAKLEPLSRHQLIAPEQIHAVYRSIETWAYVLGAAALLSGMVVAYSLIRPARRLLAERGDIEEFGSLSPEFKDMAASFRRHIAELKDAAKMKEMLIELRKAERLASIGGLAMAVAHEVRNPLASIRGFAQLIKEDLPKEDPKGIYLDTIIKEVDRLNRVVDGLYEMRDTQFEGDTLKEMIFRIRLLCEEALKGKPVGLIEQYKDDSASHMIMDERVFHGIYNIVLNAYEAVPPEGRVFITAGREEKGLRVEVTSESELGKGLMAGEELFKDEVSTKGRARGAGLGIARTAIRQAGGGIAVSSGGKGKTVFTIWIP